MRLVAVAVAVAIAAHGAHPAAVPDDDLGGGGGGDDAVVGGQGEEGPGHEEKKGAHGSFGDCYVSMMKGASWESK